MTRATERLILAILAIATSAAAKPPPIDAELAAIREDLLTRDAARLERGLRGAQKRDAPSPLLERPLAELLRGGLPVDLAKLAIVDLAAYAHEPNAEVIAPYARHRDPETRRVALLALGTNKGKIAESTLRQGLGDAEASVRDAAAEGLGRLGSRLAVGDLFEALHRGVAGAGLALAGLCQAEECDQVVSGSRSLPLPDEARIFDRLLTRDGLPLAKRVALARVIAGLGTDQARSYALDATARGVGTVEIQGALGTAK